MKTIKSKFVEKIINDFPSKYLFIVKGFETEIISESQNFINLEILLDNDESVNKPNILKRLISLISIENSIFMKYSDFAIVHKLNMFGIFEASNFKIALIDFNFFNNFYFTDYNDLAVDIERLVNTDDDNFSQVVFSNFEFDNGRFFYTYNILNYSFENTFFWQDSNNIPVINKSDLEIDFIKSSESSLGILNYALDKIRDGSNFIFFRDKRKNNDFLDYVIKSLYQINRCILEVDNFPVTGKQIFEYDYLSILRRKDSNFDFRKLPIYNKPEFYDKDIIEISQEVIINEIYMNAINAYKNLPYFDTFLTSPTGSGKSIMFQIPAIKLAEEFNLVTIVISPLIGLMNDQVSNIIDMTNLAATINSDFTPNEKEQIKNEIDEGIKSILYVSPETLLSNTDITTLIGRRQIGLMVVDEAHTVATWGKSFRPDYWYLGDFLKGLKKYNKDLKFPIAAFTATATYGGLDDMYYDIIDSLGLRIKKPYIGRVIRDDINFDISVKKSQSDYKKEKELIVKKRIYDYIDSNKKTLVYFPYVSSVKEIYNSILVSKKDKVAKYTGGLNKLDKSESMIDFKEGTKTIMLATKAFGMGIDINDITNVYHYAPTGNLSDYVQEIGRAARREDIIGVAATDYYSEDFKFIKQLYGMSSVKKYEIMGVLKKIIDLYNTNFKRNMLVSPEDFAHIFSRNISDEDIDNRLKTVLLIVKKDLESSKNLSSYALKFKPRGMYTKGLYLIKDEHISYFNKIGWLPYLQLFRNKKQLERYDNGEKITYLGDVYMLDFKALWQDKYRDFSFGQFKKQIFDGKIKNVSLTDKLISKVWLEIETLHNRLFSEVLEKFNLFMTYLTEVLDFFHTTRKLFTMREFSDEIMEKSSDMFKNLTQTELIVNSALNLINNIEVGHRIGAQYFMQYNSSTDKYTILNSNYKSKKEEMLRRARKHFSPFGNQQETMFIQDNAQKGDKMRSNILIVITQIFALLDVVKYTIKSGDRPEFFIRVNDVGSLEKMNDNYYQSPTLNKLLELHNSSMTIMDFFFRHLNNDKDRWELIEKYFLGEDIIKVISDKLN